MRLLDTSVVIDHLRGYPAAVELLDSLLASDETLAASEVVRFELLAGVRDGERAPLERFFESVSWIPVDEWVTRAAGALARQHRRAYSGIDDADYMIAATALLLDTPLLTKNVRHFPMLQGLAAPY